MFHRLLPVIPVFALAACGTAPVPDKIEPLSPEQVAAYMNPSSSGPSGFSSSAARRNPTAYSSTRVRSSSRPISAPVRAAARPPRAIPVLAEESGPKRVDVYRSKSDIRGVHRVVGEVRLSTDGRQPPQEIRSAFEREAASRNAQAVIIQDPADRPIGSDFGPSFEDSREIRATFVRYGERPSRGYGVGAVSPYSNQYSTAY